jgi:protein AATF/BFR2
VSRDALEDASDDDDPFRRHESDESDEEDLDEHDSDLIDNEDEDLSEDEADENKDVEGMYELDSNEEIEHDSEDQSDGSDGSDDLSASDEEDTAPRATTGTASNDRDELRRLMTTDQKSVAATISQAAKADATKGLGVRKQRLTFDALLNARIKLQKGLAVVNDLPNRLDEEANSADDDAIKSAESAALALWSTLETLRLALADVHSRDDSKKRKRLSAVSITSPESLWQRMQDLEVESQIHRRAVLEKWNHKVRGTNANLPNARGKLLGNSDKQSITAVLDSHIGSEISDRASKKQRTNGSSDTHEQLVYDDAAFYQSLLRDLVEQRMSSSDAVTNGLDSLHLQLPTHRTSGMRKDKVHKDVDTKASKGRKMRYNVHEKLQNFMAPEDRGSWTGRARDEFFASLLGKSASGLLGESDEEDNANGATRAASDEEDVEEGGLRLFRS